MASLNSVINLIFNATNNASGAINAIAGDLGKLDVGVQGVAAPFADLANSLLKAEAAAFAFGAAISVLAVRETIQFQDSLQLVAKQLGDSGVSIEQARKDIEALALAYGINANEVAKSLAGFLAAGQSYESSAQLVATSTQLMIAGELEAAFAVEAINKSLAGFRVPAEEAAASATKIGDVLNKIGDISSGQFEEIVQGFSRISPTAKDAGLSMEETAAIIASLVDIFGSGEIAATALKSGLLSLLAPSTAAEEALTQLGVASTDSNGQLRSSKELLVDLAGKWNTLTDAQKQQTAAILFGKEQAGAMSAVLGDWAKVQSYVTQLLDETTGAVGSMAREVESKLKLISASVDQANESWRQFLENLGARITDGDQLQGLISNVGAVGIAFKSVVNQGGFDPLIDLLKQQAGSLSTLVESIAQNLPAAFQGLDWSGLLDSLSGLQNEIGDVFRAFFGEIDLTTVDGLTKALQTVMNTFDALTRVVTGIIGEFEPFSAMIGGVVRKFDELDNASQLEFGQFLGQMKLLVDAGTGLGLVLIAIGKAGADVSGVLNLSFGAVKTTINALQFTFDAVVLKLYEIKKATLESKIAEENTPWGSPDKLEEYRRKLAEVELQIGAVTANLDKNGQEFDQGAAQIQKGIDALNQSDEAFNKAADSAQKLASGTQEAGFAAKDASGNLMDWSDGLRQANTELKTHKDTVQAAIVPLMDWSDGVKNAKATTIAWGESLQLPPLKLPEGVEKAEEVFRRGGQAAGNYVTAIEGVSTAYSQVGSGTVKATGAFAAVADETQNAKDQLDALTKGGKLTVEQLNEITKTANDFEAKMEEIASNERIKTIELAVELNVARLETDMERVKATFASIDNTVTSTGDLIGSLFGNLTGTDDRFKELEIESQIDLENQRRQEVLDIQKKLAEAEIARIEAQTRQYNRGDPIIKIDGTGLEPQLEAFMWEILKAIRTQVNAEFADYLLGVGVTA